MENEMMTEVIEEIATTEMPTMPTIEVIPTIEPERKQSSNRTVKIVAFGAGVGLTMKLVAKPLKKAAKRWFTNLMKPLVREVMAETAAEQATTSDAEITTIDESTVETIEEETE